jgi:cytochrome oxidase Cu insertion factor (SCO1/SenC/PrrC family)
MGVKAKPYCLTKTDEAGYSSPDEGLMATTFRTPLVLAALAAVLVTGPCVPLAAQNKTKPQAPHSTPQLKYKVGDIAPDFTLRDQNGKEVSLHDFRGKKDVVLAFYVFAFTGG